MTRKIIGIISDRCTGCGLCIQACPNGALEVSDGLALLVDDRLCCCGADCSCSDGGGSACAKACPEEALEIVDREGADYDRRYVASLSSGGACNCGCGDGGFCS
ncbi:MAG TPA: hypothetical protein ENN88_02640 [Candidatus Coatesbacteria bacterium]|nr:hypothetical protein [Candidatus Coatesbacteria bacterium]